LFSGCYASSTSSSSSSSSRTGASSKIKIYNANKKENINYHLKVAQKSFKIKKIK